MGTLSIIEGKSTAREGANAQPVHEFKSGEGIVCTQLSTSGASSRQILKASTAWVTLSASEAMYIQIGGASVEATTTDYQIAANAPFSFKVDQEGVATYIAAEDVA